MISLCVDEIKIKITLYNKRKIKHVHIVERKRSWVLLMIIMDAAVL